MLLKMQCIIIHVFANVAIYMLIVLKVHRVSYQAPTGKRVKATILDMDLPSSSKYDCYHWLEFRDYLIGAPGKE